MKKLKKYSPIDIAYKFIDLGISNNKPLKQIKLNKLLYITHGLYLAKYNESLFNEQPIAKPFGPLFKSVSDKFAIVGNSDFDYLNVLLFHIKLKFNSYPENLESFLLDIYYNTRNLNEIQLLNFTNDINGAWHTMYVQNKFDRIIPDEQIINEFKKYIIN